MNIGAARISFTSSHKTLRRARHLFILLHVFRRNFTILRMYDVAKAMKRHGLYAPATGDKDIVFHVLRHQWRMEQARGLYLGWRGWWDWREAHGWESVRQAHKYEVEKKQQAALVGSRMFSLAVNQ